MRKIIIFTLVVAIANITLFAQAGTIPTGGKNRDYIVYVPSGLTDNAPLVLALHPLGATNTNFRSMSGWDKVADKDKIVVAYPQGITPVSMGGSNLIGWDITGDSDVNFMLALIDTMAARYKIDRKRVYSTGFSMGGMLSYVLACKQSDKIAAIGPDAGYPVGQNASSCSPSAPVPVCHVHGAKDDFVKYADLPPWIKKFASVNKCQTSPKTTTGDKYTKDDYSPCDKENEVILYSITAMAHEYATSSKHGFSATDTFWTFFKRHPGTTGAVEPVVRNLRSRTVSVRYTTGTITLKHAADATAARLFDSKGRMIGVWNNIAGQSNLAVRPLQGGIYLFSVSRPDGETVLRLTIQ